MTHSKKKEGRNWFAVDAVGICFATETYRWVLSLAWQPRGPWKQHISIRCRVLHDTIWSRARVCVCVWMCVKVLSAPSWRPDLSSTAWVCLTVNARLCIYHQFDLSQGKGFLIRLLNLFYFFLHTPSLLVILTNCLRLICTLLLTADMVVIVKTSYVVVEGLVMLNPLGTRGI